MLAKRKKIELRKDDVFFQNALKTGCGGFLLYSQKNDFEFKASVIVSKKNAPLASKRVQLKRYVYQALEEMLPQIEPWQRSVAIVIVNPEKISSAEHFPEELLCCLTKIRLQDEKNNH